jgi:hypothetical protein
VKFGRLAAGLCCLAFVSVRPAWCQRAGLAPPVLHHLNIVLDSATWRDVRVSPLFRGQFAGHDSSITEDCRSLYGKYNYVTLCRPGRQVQPRARPGDPGPLSTAGDVEIVLSYETPGALDRVVRTGSFQRFGENSGPGMWYDALVMRGPDSTSDRARFAFLEYTAETARRLATTDSLPLGNLSNARFMANDFDGTRLLSRVSGATLAIPVDDIGRIRNVLEHAGVTVLAEGEGAIIKLDGFTLHLIPSFVGAGVKQLHFVLTRTAVGNPIYRFGPKSQLWFGPGPIAVWDFNSK